VNATKTNVIETGGRKIVRPAAAAKALGVSPRMVQKMVDSGALEGFKLPGSRDRRIFHDALEATLRRLGITKETKPLVWLVTTPQREDRFTTLLCGLARTEHIGGIPDAIDRLTTERPAAAVVDAGWLTRDQAALLTRGLQCGSTPTPVVLVVSDDETGQRTWANDATLVVPDFQLDLTRAVEWIAERVTKKPAPQQHDRRTGRKKKPQPQGV
jgi:hypothetical protein